MGKKEFAAASLTLGQMNAFVKKAGGPEAVMKVLRGELIISLSEPARKWREKDGVIYLTVTSDGTTGPEWIERLEMKNICFRNFAKSTLLSSNFKPTNGIITEIAILKGMLFQNHDRNSKKICNEADTRHLTKPNAEVACLIRENFSDKEIEAMGLWRIVIMHEHFNDPDSDPTLLIVSRGNLDSHWLDTDYAGLDQEWGQESGFAFSVSQV